MGTTTTITTITKKDRNKNYPLGVKSFSRKLYTPNKCTRPVKCNSHVIQNRKGTNPIQEPTFVLTDTLHGHHFKSGMQVVDTFYPDT